MSSSHPPALGRPIVVVLEASDERQAAVAAQLWDIATVSTELTTAAGQRQRIVIVDLAGDPERALRRLDDVRSSLPKVQLVALADRKDPDLILRAMRVGAREFVLLDDDGELVDVVAALLKQSMADDPSGTIITVFPAKGGVGATTIATNLASELCRTEKGKGVLLVDLDRQLGDVLVFLDMTPSFSIAEVVKNLARFDRELWLSSLGRHKSGIFVLAQPDPLEDGDSVGASQVSTLLKFAARNFDYVVCDGVRGFDELSLAVLDVSHRVELVLTQDVVALKNAKRCLDIFQRLNYDDQKVSLIVNRFDKREAIDLAFIAESLERDVRSTLANDHPAAMAALNAGVPLRQGASRSKLTRDVEALAAYLAGRTQSQDKRGFFGSLFGRNAESEDAKRGQKGGDDVTRRTSETT